MDGDGRPVPPAATPRYEPVQLQDEAPAATSRRPRRAAGAVAVAAAAAALVGYGCSGRSPGAAAVRHARAGAVAFLEAAESKADAKRTCISLEGVRLDNGEGSYDSASDMTADDCVDLCKGRSNCSQTIYSSFAKACFMFEKPKAALYTKGDSDPANFRSAFCGDDGVQLEALRYRMEDKGREEEVEQVRQRWKDAEANATIIVQALSETDKLSFVQGNPGGLGYAGFLKPSGIRGDVIPLKMQDGPQGFNPYQAVLAGTATQFPALIAVAASFNPEVSRQYATAVAEEFVTKGANVLLGPDVEVTRAVLSGRCFETISGEDPFLGSEMVRPYIKAVQDKGIIATVKHWLDNNQEIYRQTMTAVVSERAQHEIYMPVFKAAFEAGAGAVMCAYNKINGHHACENHHLLTKLLRKDLGFKGYVVSDWGATHNAVKSAKAGLDVEMPEGKYYGNLSTLIAQGKVKASTLDTMATHVLAAMHFVGQFEGRFPADKAAALGHLPATTDEHRQVAHDTIIESAVLLKNEGKTLPIAAAGKKIALIGKYCNHSNDKNFGQGAVYSGGGSGYVITTRTIKPIDGIKQHFSTDPSIEVTYSRDGSAAEGADYAVICAAAHAEEGWDRANLSLPEAGDLIVAARKAGGDDLKVIVLASAPGAITTEWLKGADAAILLFEPGEQVGPAVAKLLTGDASPAGRLPVSLPKENEERFTKWQYPGLCKDNSWCEAMYANFSENTLVGYRWNDAMEVPSAFPFGFGLTYTEFEFKDLYTSCEGGVATVAMRVANTGDRDGTAVPQLYVGFDSLKPVIRQLRGFRKVQVAKGEETTVVFLLREADWSYFDEAKDEWVSALSKGEEVKVWIGASSVDLPLQATLKCGDKAVEA